MTDTSLKGIFTELGGRIKTKLSTAGATVTPNQGFYTIISDIIDFINTKVSQTEFETYKTQNSSNLDSKVDKVSGKGLSTEDYTTEEQTKLSGIELGANKTVIDSSLSTSSTNPVQNKVINTALSGKQDTLTAGTNIEISNNTITAVDTQYNNATTSTAGLMSSSDKSKLDGIAANANKYELPKATTTSLGGIKVGSNLSITDDGTLSATDTLYNDATQSAHGLMTATDKTKLDGIEEGATKVIVDSLISSTSENPLQNKVIQAALQGKQNNIDDLTTIRSGAGLGATAVQPSEIANMVKTNDNISVLYNDAGYLTEHQSLANYYTKTQIDSTISGITQFDYEVVTTLPTSGVKGTIYLTSDNKGEQDIYDEWLWLADKWEKIGTTKVDLTDYATETYVNDVIGSGFADYMLS